MIRIQRSVIRSTVFAYAIALWLPSYSFSIEARQFDINQIGFQSLFAPDMGISRWANYLYFALLAMSIRDTVPQSTRLGLSSILLALLVAVGYLHLFGELPPGAKMHIGPGAFLWFGALMVAAITNIPLKLRQGSAAHSTPDL